MDHEVVGSGYYGCGVHVKRETKRTWIGGRGISEGGIIVFYQVLLMC